MPTKRRIALSGLGIAARTIHLPAYRRLPGLEVVGGFDPVVDPASFPFPMFPSLGKLLSATRPDILAVVSPPEFHFEQICQGLNFGCHVFCEKPFTNSMEEADRVVELCRTSGLRVVVNHEFRYMGIHVAAKKALKTEEFGDLLFASAYQTFLVTKQTEAGWRGRSAQRTCREFGIHVLDLFRYFFEQEPLRIFASMPRPTDPDGPDYLNLIHLEFPEDRAASITLDRLSRGEHRYLDIQLDGSAGVVRTSIGGRVALQAGINARSRLPYVNFDIAMGGLARFYRGERYRKIGSDPLNLFAHATRNLMRLFLNALDNGSTPPCDAEDSRQSLRLVLAAYKSAAESTPIDLAPRS